MRDPRFEESAPLMRLPLFAVMHPEEAASDRPCR